MRLRWVGLLAVLLIPAPAAHGATAAVLGTGVHPTVAVDATGVGHAVWLVPGASISTDTLRYCQLPRTNPTTCQSPQTLTPPDGRGGDPHVLISGSNVFVVLPRYVQGDVLVWTSAAGAPFTGPVTVGKASVGTDTDDAVLGPAGSAFVASSNPATYVQQVPLAGGPPAAASARFATDFTSYVYTPTIGTFGSALTPVLVATDNPTSTPAQIAFWRYTGGDVNTVAAWAGPTKVDEGNSTRLAGGPAGLVLMSNSQQGKGFNTQLQSRHFDESSSTFGPAVNVGKPEDARENDLAQAQAGGAAAGRLFAVWVHDSGLRLSTSSNGGAAWSTPTDIVREQNLFHLRVEAAPDGQGFVVWDQNSDGGQVKAAPLIPIAGSGGGGGSSADSKLKPSQVIKLPSTKKCRSRRSFRIRLVVPKGVIIATASVRVNGKRVKVVRKRRLTSFVNLVGLPKGRYSVKIVVVTEAGKILTTTRRYRTCAPRRRG